MAKYLKPQTPLQHQSGDYIYPITTVDQVITAKGERLNANLISVDLNESVESDTNINLANNKPKAGFIYPLASDTVPEGFLLCDGAEYLRTEYPELFAAIGTMYGTGDGSTTFNVPNLQTRVPVGAGDGYELGDVGGSQPHNNMQPYTVVNYIIATGKNTGVSVTDIITGTQALPLDIEYGGTGATNAETARVNLGITPENIGAMSMDLLWENASPTSDFGDNNVSIARLSGFEMYAVVFIVVNNGKQTITNINYKGCGGVAVVAWGDTNENMHRNYGFLGDGIAFRDAYSNKLMSNNALVPWKVYGIKGVS